MTKVAGEVSCVLCGEGSLLELRAYRPRSGIFCESSVARCERCGLMQVVPMPDSDELDRFYQSAYRPAEGARPISPYDDPTDLNFRTASQVEFIRKHLPHLERVVDVGCGYGLLLKCLGDIFPQAKLFGVEVSEICQPALKQLGVQVARTTLERAGGNPFDERFDLLTCSHVLEHSCQAPRFLSLCRLMVREGGFVMIEVPNCQFDYGADSPHLCFFTVQTLADAMKRAGFEVISCQPCGPTIDRWLPNSKEKLRNYLDDHLPIGMSRGLKSLWRNARGANQVAAVSDKTVEFNLKKLKEEAKDQAWFAYAQPGFKHSAIRCAAIRPPDLEA